MKQNLLHSKQFLKILWIGIQKGEFQFWLIMILKVISFHAVVVLVLAFSVLFRLTLPCYVYISKIWAQYCHIYFRSDFILQIVFFSSFFQVELQKFEVFFHLQIYYVDTRNKLDIYIMILLDICIFQKLFMGATLKLLYKGN